MKVTFKSGQLAVYPLQDFDGGTLEKLGGFVTGTANQPYYLHIFDIEQTPTNGAIPKRSEQVLGQDGFRFDYSDNDLEFKNGMIFALSSSEETYTAVVDGAKVDWEGEIDTQAIQGSTTVGDVSTGVNSLQVWTSAQGPRYLLEVDWISNAVANSFLLFFTKNNPVNGDVPDIVIGALDTSTSNPLTRQYRFGKSGLNARSTSGLKGCTLCVSSTANVLTLVGTTENIRAKYKTTL